MDLAIRAPKTVADIGQNGPGPANRSVRRYQRQWLTALDRARQVAEADLPVLTPRSEGPPPARAWADRDPVAAARLVQARAALGQFAKTRHIPIENVLSPDFIRRVLWAPPPDSTLDSVGTALLSLGARQWQVDIAGPILEEAINRPTPVTEATTDEVGVEVTDE
jgi:ribonuclease D